MTMPDWLDPHWVWLIAAGILAIAEILVPGVFLIWMGLAALVTGLIVLVFPIPIVAQVLIFAIATAVTLTLARRFLKRRPIESSDVNLNDKAARMIGTIVTAAEAVDALQGRVKAGDSVWSARGAEAQPGDRLRVTGVNGTVLLVERA